MKKTVLFLMALILSGTLGITSLAWAQVQPAPTPLQPKQVIPIYPPKKVFITSRSHTGNFGGLAGADAFCQEWAQYAGLTGTYKAWLGNTKVNPNMTFKKHPGPYQLLNGVVIARNWQELVNSPQLSPITITEYGTAVMDPFGYTGIKVWTGMYHGGTAVNFTLPQSSIYNTCNDWTVSSILSPVPGYTPPPPSGSPGDVAYVPPSYFGRYGVIAPHSDAGWSGSLYTDRCGGNNHLYCFEQ